MTAVAEVLKREYENRAEVDWPTGYVRLRGRTSGCRSLRSSTNLRPAAIALEIDSTPERIARGKVLASAICLGCHMDPVTMKVTGRHMSDAPPEFGPIYSNNITRHPQKGIGSWSDGELAYLLRTGITRDGTYIPPYMVKLPHMSDMKTWRHPRRALRATHGLRSPFGGASGGRETGAWLR